MSYVIAAYAIVIGSLVIYALRMQSERRKLIRQNERGANASGRR